MKKLFAGIICAAAITACGGAQKSSEAADSTVVATPAAAMLGRLAAVVADSAVVFGHHDDTAYGHDWSYEPGRSDVLETSGRYPGLMNWDLGLVELGDSVQLDGVPLAFIRSEVLAQHERGGINAISWHPRNPVSKHQRREYPHIRRRDNARHTRRHCRACRANTPTRHCRRHARRTLHG